MHWCMTIKHWRLNILCLTGDGTEKKGGKVVIVRWEFFCWRTWVGIVWQILDSDCDEKFFGTSFGISLKSGAKILAIFFAKLSGAFELYFHTNFSCSFSLICDATNVLKSRDLTSIKRNFFKFMNEHDEKVSKPHVQFRPFSLAPAWLRCLRKMFNINSRNFKLFTSVAVVQPEATQRNFPILRLNSSEWWE